MTDWPDSLVREIAARRCVLFLGSGVSASAKDSTGKGMMTWKDFLNRAIALVKDHKIKKEIATLIKQGNYLLALEGIRSESNTSDFRSLLDAAYNKQQYMPGELHQTLLELDSRIIVTTNFDKVYENLCNGSGGKEAYKVIRYTSNDLCDELRSDTRLIIKAHGTIDEISTMVFTRSEYHAARSNHHGFYEILKAIFLTNTIVFIGCGMQDPDMLLLLEDVKIVGSSEKSHYVVAKKGSFNQITKRDMKCTYNIEVLEYGPSHEDLSTDLDELLNKVLRYRALHTL